MMVCVYVGESKSGDDDGGYGYEMMVIVMIPLS
jgi:hypothetical protein